MQEAWDRSSVTPEVNFLKLFHPKTSFAFALCFDGKLAHNDDDDDDDDDDEDDDISIKVTIELTSTNAGEETEDTVRSLWP